jgi:acetyl-CoA acyltransferase 1
VCPRRAPLSPADLAVTDVLLVPGVTEAFASQAAYTVKKLGINPSKVNPVGGAIAFGVLHLRPFRPRVSPEY